MKRTTNKKPTRKNKARQFDARNQLGTPPGLGLELNWRSDGSVYASWRATFHDENGVFRVKTYAIQKYGYRQAFHLAAQTRHEYAKQPIIYPLPPRKLVAAHLRDRIGPDWQQKIRPVWRDWWAPQNWWRAQ